LVIALTACTTDRVVVDKRGLDQARYEKDLAECRDYKQQVPVGEEMAKGAAVDTSEEKARIVKNCLRGRGYRVLN